MSYYDDKDDNSVAGTALGAGVGSIAGYGAHRLANREGYKEYDKYKAEKKSWKSDFKEDREWELENAGERVKADYEAIEALHKEHTPDLAEHTSKLNKTAELHDQFSELSARQKEVVAELKETGHKVNAKGELSHGSNSGVSKGMTEADTARVNELHAEHQANTAKMHEVGAEAQKIGISSDHADGYVNKLKTENTRLANEIETKQGEARTKINSAIEEGFGDRAGLASENHRVMKAQERAGFNADIGETVRSQGKKLSRLPENAVNSVRNTAHNTVEGTRANASKTVNGVRSKLFTMRSGESLDLSALNYKAEEAPHKIKSHADVVTEGRARATARLTGEYQKPVRSEYKPKKVGRPSGGVRSAIAGLAMGAVAGHIIGKVQNATSNETVQHFDPYAAQALAGPAVVPPYDMGNYEMQIAAERAAAAQQQQMSL